MDIKQLRTLLSLHLSNGITLNSVAQTTHIKQASLWRFLRCGKSLSGDSVFRLLEYLNVRITLPEDVHGEQ